MGFQLRAGKKSVARKAFRLGVHVLALAVASAPLPSSSTSVYASQSDSQSSASGTNSLASGLSTLVSGLSMAMGGLAVYNGASELKDCATSMLPGTAGAQSQASQAATQAAAGSAAQAIPPAGVPGGATPPPAPTRAPASSPTPTPPPTVVPPHTWVPTWQQLPLWKMWRPQEAQAMSKCVSGSISLLTGGLMLLQGIMGMMAAKQAKKNANTAADNAAGLSSSLPTAGLGTSPTPDSLNGKSSDSTMTGENGASGNSKEGKDGANGGSGKNAGTSIGSQVAGGADAIKIDPSLLRTGKANDIMMRFEDRFGIPRDQFMDAVANGKDPRQLLMNAPKNAISPEDMNKAISGAQSLSDSQKSNALASSEYADLQKEMAAQMNGTGASKEAEYVAGGTSSAFKGGNRKPAAEGLDDLPPFEGASNLPGLSTEVQAALQAQELEKGKAGLSDLSIFQLVHNKYIEKSRMIFGLNPGAPGGTKGVGNADGL